MVWNGGRPGVQPTGLLWCPPAPHPVVLMSSLTAEVLLLGTVGKVDPQSKRRSRDCSLLVDHVLSVGEDLGSTPRTVEKKKSQTERVKAGIGDRQAELSWL